MRFCEQCGAAFRFARSCPRDNLPLVAASADPLIGRVLGGRYRVLERVGAGGMGQVYRAAHTRIACVFAVKVVWGDFAYERDMQVRFAREAETASCLSSRHIVRVVDFAEGEGALPYLVMEYLDGASLYDVIAREGALKPARAALIAERIARGLAHAHERGVVHRDLKPENIILVSEDDERDIPKILDFGVAKMKDGERLTGFGVAIGTPLYMAPEQFLGGEIDGRTDLYALGAVLHEMLTGRPPFESTTLQELTRQHLETPPPSVAGRAAPGLDLGALDQVVQQLMTKQREARVGSAREAVALLREAARSGEPRSELRPSMPPSVAEQPVVSAALAATIEQAIVAGAPRYNTGDHAGCYDGYRRAAEDVARTAELAVGARLRAALERAATRTSPTDAAWDLRYAFDDLMTAPRFRPRGDRLADHLAAFVCISGRREAEGRLDLLGDYQVAFAEALAGDLRAEPRLANLVAALDRGAALGRAAGGGAAAMRAVEPVLATLRVRGGLNVSAVSLPTASAPPSGAAFAQGDLRERLVRAIRAGAPAYNEGRHDACARIYGETASAIVAAADPSQAAQVAALREALERARGAGPTEAAWILRHAFDALLAG